MTLCVTQGGAGSRRTKPSIPTVKVWGETMSSNMDLCSQTQMWDMNPGFSPLSKHLFMRCLYIQCMLYKGLVVGDKSHHLPQSLYI